MKIFPSALTAILLFAFATDGSPNVRTIAEGKKKDLIQLGAQNPMQQDQQSSPTTTSSGNSCNLTGTYKKGTDISSCSSITIDSLSVPGGVTLDMSRAKKGAIIEFKGTTTFGTQLWNGPLVMVSGTDLTVKGSGILDGQGAWYWKKGPSITRPVFFRLQSVVTSKVSGFTVKNMPYRTLSVVTCKNTVISGITIDSGDGNGMAENTDGFDLSKNEAVTITGCTIINQDDCLAMQSSTNTVFSYNLCDGSHGISIGSLGGLAVDASTTVRGLTVEGNTIINSDNGLRIKTIGNMKGLISDVKYINNKVQNVRYAVVFRSDYNREKGRYLGKPNSQVQITDVTVSGLTGTAGNLYDINVNPNVVSNWKFQGVDVKASVKGTTIGMPNSLNI